MRKLVATAVSLVGLAVFVQSLGYDALPGNVAIASIPLTQKLPLLLVVLIPALLALAVAVYLVAARNKIAAWYVPDADAAPTIEGVDLARAGIVVLGVYLVVQALPSLVTVASNPVSNYWLLRSTMSGDFASFNVQSSKEMFIKSVPTALGALTSIGVGSFLLAKREYLVARLFGTPATQGAAEDQESLDVPRT
jgi:hypothetical protein